MKKILSFVLFACFSISFCLSFASCGHAHVFKQEWTADATHHWHACEKEGCLEASEKAEHTWDEGRITVPATAQLPGQKTFFCTVCGGEKHESIVIKTTVTDEEWAQATKPTNFTVSALVTEKGNQESSTYKITDASVEDFIANRHPLPAGVSFIYDGNTTAYVFESAEAEATEGDITTRTYSDKYFFYFEDGKLAKFEFAEGGYTEFDKNTLETTFDDTRTGDVTHSYTFSDYGTTTK